MNASSAVLICFCFLSCGVSAPDVEDCQKVPGTCDQSDNALKLTVPKTFPEPLTEDDELRILHQNESLFKVVKPGENVILPCSSSKYYLNKLNYSNGKSSNLVCYELDTKTSSPSKTGPSNKAANWNRIGPVGLFGMVLLGMGMVRMVVC